MSVVGISSTNVAVQPSLLATFQQRRNDFQQLAQSLQSGDLAGAQAAFTDLTNLSQNSKAGASSSTSQIGQDFAAIGQALQSGDLAGAQQAFATFQQDVKGAFQPPSQNSQAAQQQVSVQHHHHHHGAGSSASSDDSQSGASNGDSISITDASGDKITINLGASGSSNGGPEQVTLNFGNNSGPEQVTLNLSGNDNITLNFGSTGSSSSSSQSAGSQLNVSA